MPFLKECTHLASRQSDQITEYGEEINAKTYDGASNCGYCTYDEQLRTGYPPNCVVCDGKGKIPLYTDNNFKVLVHWITEADLVDSPVGGIQAGDLRLMATFSRRSIFENEVNNEVIITVDSKSVIPKRVVPNTLETIVHVYCSRTETS